jgi:cytochrome c-type biogenesis protein CcmH/NrfG
MLTKIRKSLKELKQESQLELEQTKEMTKLLWEARKRDLTAEEKEKVMGQSLDLGRLILLSALFVVPGSGVLIVLLVKGGNKIGIRFLPSSFVKNKIDIK